MTTGWAALQWQRRANHSNHYRRKPSDRLDIRPEVELPQRMANHYRFLFRPLALILGCNWAVAGSALKLPAGDPPATRHGVVFAVGLLLFPCSPMRVRADEPTCVVHVEGDPTGEFHDFRDTPAGLLVGAENGLFRYDGTRTIHVDSEPKPEGPIPSLWNRYLGLE